MIKSTGDNTKNTLYCSFCGKSQHEVKKLIHTYNNFIRVTRSTVLKKEKPQNHFYVVN